MIMTKMGHLSFRQDVIFDWTTSWPPPIKNSAYAAVTE